MHGPRRLRARREIREGRRGRARPAGRRPCALGGVLSGELGFAVAEPRGWDLRTRSSWYGVVPGDRSPTSCSARAGRRWPSGSVRRSASSRGRRFARCRVMATPCSWPAPAARWPERARPHLRSPTTSTTALAVLARCHEAFQPRALVPVHGAPHMHQWLADQDGRLGLVDLDRYALGEPELDLATFLVELESESDRVAPMAELKRAAVTRLRGGGRSPRPDPARGVRRAQAAGQGCAHGDRAPPRRRRPGRPPPRQRTSRPRTARSFRVAASLSESQAEPAALPQRAHLSYVERHGSR